MAVVPAFAGNIGFNAHHSPMGAFFSFTVGHFGTKGGLAAQLGRPADQDVFVGVKDGGRFDDVPLKCLPFYDGADVTKDPAAAYLVEQQATSDPNHRRKVVTYAREEIVRRYGWGTDTFETPDFAFTIATPFGGIPEPGTASAEALRRALVPGVTASLVVDNTAGKRAKTAFFAVNFAERWVRMLAGLGAGRVGFAQHRELGVAAEARRLSDGGRVEVFSYLRWTPNDGMENELAPMHLLGSCPGVGVEVPVGESVELRLAIGCYLEGVVTTRLEGRYAYTDVFASLEDVLGYVLDNAEDLHAAAAEKDQELLASGLNADQQFLVAHATRSYYGSTQLLNVGGEPFWIVNEGEYCMLNTLDLAVDQVFWELEHNPWVVRNLLDNFARHYSYVDQVKRPKAGAEREYPRAYEVGPGGISFCHDMGVHNQFAPFGDSSYELANIDGCFSYMTAEQLCNWVLMAASYVVKTGDVGWARRNESVFDACLLSMAARGPENGIISTDSARCGNSAEITTYDSLDHSLAQTRNNVYMAVKTWAAYAGLEQLYKALGASAEDNEYYASARTMAGRIVEALAGHVQADGSFPAVFEKDNPGYASRILPAVEGLVYPLAWGKHEEIPERLLHMLKKHAVALLADEKGRNRFADGGVKLSSTSNNSWASKIALVQHVARELFRIDERGKPLKAPGTGGWEASDAAHVKWQTEGASAYWACSDQIVSGVAQGSKYYPRIVTTVLWLVRSA